MTEKVLYTIDEEIATITINRPDALNALNNDMIAQIIEYIKATEKNDKLRVLVLEGNGKAFCAGDDLVDMGTKKNPNPTDKFTEFREGYPRIIEQMRQLKIPIISKVHKYALGAGFEIALASDIIIADEEAQFGLPFVLRGMASGTYLLQEAIGYHRASRYLFTGEFMKSKTAYEYGIVSKLVPKENLNKAVEDMAKALAKNATYSIGLMKRAMHNSRGKSMVEAFDEQCLATTVSFHSEDFQEGKQAFIEKRDPKFTGR